MKPSGDTLLMLYGYFMFSLRHGTVMAVSTATVTTDSASRTSATMNLTTIVQSGDTIKSSSAKMTSDTSQISEVTQSSSTAMDKKTTMVPVSVLNASSTIKDERATMATNTTIALNTAESWKNQTSVAMTTIKDNNAMEATNTTIALNEMDSWTNQTSVAMTTEMNATGDTSVPAGAFVAAEVAAILCCVLGFTGNIFTLVTILITPKLRGNANNLFVCNLSAVDALYCGYVLSVKASVLHTRRWLGSDVFCTWFAASQHTIFGIALISLCAIAFNRFITVVYPQHRDRIYTRRKIAAMFALCWLMPIALNIPAIFGAWGEYAFHQDILSCTFGNDNNMDTYTHGVVLYASFLAVPIFFLVFSYCRIGIVFYKSRRRLSNLRSSSGEPLSRDIQGRQLTLSMLAICVLFIACVGPYSLVVVIDPKMDCRVCHVITPLFTWIQIALNPVVYTMTNSQFQQAYKRLLRRIFFCLDCRSGRACCVCLHGMSSPASSTPASQVNLAVRETAA